MMLPSDAFIDQIAQLQDAHGYTGKLLIDCHEGRPMAMDVPAPPTKRYVLKERRVDLQRRAQVETLRDTMK